MLSKVIILEDKHYTITKMMRTKTRSRNSTSGSCLLNGQPLPAIEERAFFEDCSPDADFEPNITLSTNHETFITLLTSQKVTMFQQHSVYKLTSMSTNDAHPKTVLRVTL